MPRGGKRAGAGRKPRRFMLEPAEARMLNELAQHNHQDAQYYLGWLVRMAHYAELGDKNEPAAADRRASCPA